MKKTISNAETVLAGMTLVYGLCLGFSFVTWTTVTLTSLLTLRIAVLWGACMVLHDWANEEEDIT